MSYIKSQIIDSDKYYLLLDEIQNLGSFESVLNGYLRKDNLDLYVTGSNSKFRAIEVRETQYSRKRKEYTPLIEKIFEESRQTYGARKISSILSDMGYHMAPKTVAEIMHNNGWFSVRSGAKKLYEQGLKRFANHVCQQFDVSEPNSLWASDMTEINAHVR